MDAKSKYVITSTSVMERTLKKRCVIAVTGGSLAVEPRGKAFAGGLLDEVPNTEQQY